MADRNPSRTTGWPTGNDQVRYSQEVDIDLDLDQLDPSNRSDDGPPADMSESPAVLVHDLHRSFGQTEVLRGMSFTADYGQITGLVGPNGAGKSTLLLILATLLRPGHGRVAVGGYDPVTQARAVRAITGWAANVIDPNERLTVREYLTFFVRAHRVPSAQVRTRVCDLLDLVELADHADQRVGTMSKGQRQLLTLGRALANQPKVLLLDEPSGWLDPHARLSLRNLLRRLAGNGTAVLLSSHLLSELEETADRVVLIDHGRTIGEYDTAELTQTAAANWRIMALDQQVLLAALADHHVAPATPTPATPTPATPTPATPTAATAATGGVLLPAMTEPEAAALLSALVASGVEVCSFARVGSALQAGYLSLIRGDA